MTDTLYVPAVPFEAQRALFAALSKAIVATRGVNKDGQGQGYLYAKAENVMREADRVLSDVGVTVAPIGATLAVVGEADTKNGRKSIFELKCRFLVAHVEGGSFVGEMAIAVGTNLGATPAQATSSAYTCCERDFYRALLRMPRGPEEDVEHPKNNRPPRDEEPQEPARPAVPVATTRKATRVLAQARGIGDLAGYEKVKQKWDEVLASRAADDDMGYSDDECAQIKSALADAAQRVGA